MKKLTLEAAKLVLDHTKRTLPLVHLRDGEKVNLARLGVLIATRAVETASEEERPLAKNELLRMQATLNEQLAAQSKIAANANLQLKKLAHPDNVDTPKVTMPIRLPSRRQRRQAVRVLACEAQRTAVLERGVDAFVAKFKDAVERQASEETPIFVEVARSSWAGVPSSKLLKTVRERLGLPDAHVRAVPVTSRTGRSRVSWALSAA